MEIDQPDESAKSDAPAIANGSPNGKPRKLINLLSGIYCAFLLAILLLYVTVSDQHPVGEFLTIWPPVLYLVPSVVILGIFSWRNSNSLRIVSAATVALFFLTLIEWRALLRFPGGQGDITVVTWNIGGGYTSESELLRSLEAHRPDLVFFQESTDGVDAFSEKTLSDSFQGYHYYDSGDCAMLSRWPCEVLATSIVGPWGNPQILLAEIAGRRVLLVNVRLMLPALVLNPFDEGSREKLWSDNRVRREQYPLLVDLIQSIQQQHQIDHVILAGDFNTDASAKSLKSIRKEFIDTWKVSGAGWGGTVTNDFPVARIDHIYVKHFKPESVWVMKSTFSDHRPVVATLSFDNSRSE